MPWWHRPHVAGTFAGLTLESVSAGKNAVRRMAVVHVAVTVRPLLHQPLAVNALGVPFDDLVLFPVYRTAAFCLHGGSGHRDPGHWWEMSEEAGWCLPSTPCVPWHSLQVGRVGIVPRNELSVRALQILLPDFGVTGRAIDTFCVIVSQGRSCDAFTPAWHWLQAIFAWREPARCSGVT